MGRGTLAPRMGMTAGVPPLRPRPTLGMDDMGMAGHGSMGGMDHGSMPGMDHGAMAGMGQSGGMAGMDMGSMDMRDETLAPADMKVGVGVELLAMNPHEAAGKAGPSTEDVHPKVRTGRRRGGNEGGRRGRE